MHLLGFGQSKDNIPYSIMLRDGNFLKMSFFSIQFAFIKVRRASQGF